VAYLDAHPSVGIAGSRLEERDGTPQRSAFRFPTVASEFEGGLRLGLLTSVLSRFVVAPPVVNENVATDWVCGASMMVRRQVFDAVGFLDDGYFMYFEELDFCLRARHAGWSCAYVPASRVVHLVGQASGIGQKTPGIPKRLPTYWFDSRRRYFVKNHGVLYAALADLAFVTGFGAWRVRRVIQGKPDEDPQGLLGDFVRNSVVLKGS
jgi:GT2 family glycosyltransferase